MNPSKQIEDIFSDDQLCKLVDWFKENWLTDEWYHAAFYVLLILCTGMRRNEAGTIALEQISLKPTPLIYLPNTKTRNTRSVEILPQFDRYFIQRVEERMEVNAYWLFKSRRLWRKPCGHQTMHKWWTSVMKELGFNGLTPKSGRHTFATYSGKIPFRNEDQGTVEHMNVLDVQAQLGHTSLKTTGDYYYHSIPGTRMPRGGESWRPTWQERL